MDKQEALIAARKKKADKLAAGAQYGKALGLYKEICGMDPLDYEAWLMAGELSVKVQDFGDAERCYRHASLLRPNQPEPCLALAMIYKRFGRYADAEFWARRYTELFPSGAIEYKRLGVEAHQRGELELAIAIYRRLLQVTPDDTDVWNNLGVALQSSGRLDEALAALLKGLEIAPPKAHLLCNIANICVDKHDYERAHDYYQQALRLDPESVATLTSLAGLYREQMRLEEALGCLNKAIAIDPECFDARFSRAQILLLQGHFKQGWLDFDARFYSREVIGHYGRRDFSDMVRDKLWDGQDITGKTLLVFAEQGFGDTIQFCRYLPLLKKRVDHLIFESRPELVRLLRSLPDPIECVAQRDDLRLPPFDYYIPLLSLPRIFNTERETIPGQAPYLAAEPDLVRKWADRMQGDEFKVGLVWAGSPGHLRDRDRSMDLAQFSPLAQISGNRFYSLQKGTAADQAALPLAGMKVVDLSAELGNFADTAAAISQLDLVITVDTSVAHLAGALGRPVWLLLHYRSEWRWLLDIEYSPWYPSMRLFRQDAGRDWAPVMQRVASELKNLAAQVSRT